MTSMSAETKIKPTKLLFQASALLELMTRAGFTDYMDEHPMDFNATQNVAVSSRIWSMRRPTQL
jgi:hypothetical protein